MGIKCGNKRVAKCELTHCNAVCLRPDDRPSSHLSSHYGAIPSLCQAIEKALEPRPQKLQSKLASPSASNTLPPSTEESHVYWIKRFILFHDKRHAKDMGALPTLYATTAPDVQGGDYIGPDSTLFPLLRDRPLVWSQAAA